MRSITKKMYSDARRRARLKGLEFNIELEDLEIPEYCPILGLPLESNLIHPKDNSPTLDRMDNTLGYIKGNVWVISRLANNMKSSATIEQLKLFAEWINTKFPDI